MSLKAAKYIDRFDAKKRLKNSGQAKTEEVRKLYFPFPSLFTPGSREMRLKNAEIYPPF